VTDGLTDGQTEMPLAIARSNNRVRHELKIFRDIGLVEEWGE